MSQATNPLASAYAETLKPHVSLFVRDVPSAVEFYQAMFGVPPLKHYRNQDTMHSVLKDDQGESAELIRTGYAKFDLSTPPLNLVLNEVQHQAGGALSHLGVQLASTAAVLELKRLLSARGLRPRDEMNIACCYALQDKFWLADPDGNEWEFFTVLADLPAQAKVSECGVCKG